MRETRRQRALRLRSPAVLGAVRDALLIHPGLDDPEQRVEPWQLGAWFQHEAIILPWDGGDEAQRLLSQAEDGDD